MKQFLCKVSTERYDEKNNLRKAKEEYLVYAETCTAAEEKLIEKEDAEAEADFIVTDVFPVIYHEIFINAGVFDGKFYKITYVVDVYDEKRGRVKSKKRRALVCALSLQEALFIFLKTMKDVTVSPVVTAIQETPIIKIYESEAPPPMARRPRASIIPKKPNARPRTPAPMCLRPLVQIPIPPTCKPPFRSPQRRKKRCNHRRTSESRRRGGGRGRPHSSRPVRRPSRPLYRNEDPARPTVRSAKALATGRRTMRIPLRSNP